MILSPARKRLAAAALAAALWFAAGALVAGGFPLAALLASAFAAAAQFRSHGGAS